MPQVHDAMDVNLTDEQVRLRSSAREFLAAECPRELIRDVMSARRAVAPGPGTDLWEQMAELGWMGLVLPETHGGAGLDAVDLAVLLEETGRVLLPLPYWSTVLCGEAIRLAGTETQRAEVLPEIARGKLRLAFAQLEAGGSWEAGSSKLEARPAGRDDGAGYVLSGRKLFVPDAQDAQQLVVAARTSEGPSLFLVDREAPGVAVEPIEYVDPTRPMSAIGFHEVALPPSALLGESGRAGPVLEELHAFARTALCAEMCGGAQRVLDMSVDFAKTREQFGKPIGSFQAIAHKCADMFVRVESIRSAAYYAAWALAAEEPDAGVSDCMAMAYCAEAFAHVAGEAIQIHGGLGFTWEQDLHLYYKRAKASEVAFGDVAFTRELAATQLIGPGAW
jgi:alkylation response protein AidB-like acyl-CoA dehydrogenase